MIEKRIAPWLARVGGLSLVLGSCQPQNVENSPEVLLGEPTPILAPTPFLEGEIVTKQCEEQNSFIVRIRDQEQTIATVWPDARRGVVALYASPTAGSPIIRVFEGGDKISLQVVCVDNSGGRLYLGLQTTEGYFGWGQPQNFTPFNPDIPLGEQFLPPTSTPPPPPPVVVRPPSSTPEPPKDVSPPKETAFPKEIDLRGGSKIINNSVTYGLWNGPLDKDIYGQPSSSGIGIENLAYLREIIAKYSKGQVITQQFFETTDNFPYLTEAVPIGAPNQEPFLYCYGRRKSNGVEKFYALNPKASVVAAAALLSSVSSNDIAYFLEAMRTNDGSLEPRYGGKSITEYLINCRAIPGGMYWPSDISKIIAPSKVGLYLPSK